MHPSIERSPRFGASVGASVTACFAACIAVCVAASVVAGCAGAGYSAAAPSGAAPALTTERIAAIVASPDRSAADRENDVRRKPVEMLAFIGMRPGMRVLDVSAGGGYTSELLARAVGPTGQVFGQSAPVDPQRTPPAMPEGGDVPKPATPGAAMPAPRMTSAMRVAERAKLPEASSLSPVLAPFDDPVPPSIAPGSLDLVTLMFNYHDLGHMGTNRASMNAAIFHALKPGGLYVIADHAGRDGTGISESGTLHRVEEAFVVREVEAAGFRLVGRGSFLHNPDDPRDRNTPEPPMPKDEFVLKFMRPG